MKLTSDLRPPSSDLRPPVTITVPESRVMTTWIALLRGINIAGRKTVSMSELRALLERLGFDEPRTLLNSGNAVFGSEIKRDAALERLLEEETSRAVGFDVKFFVRSSKEWEAIIASNPLPDEAKRDPGHFVAVLLKEPVDAAHVTALQDAIPGREIVRVAGRHAWMFYPDGLGRSKLTTALIEKKLGTSVTARNWNTAVKLAALAAERQHKSRGSK